MPATLPRLFDKTASIVEVLSRRGRGGQPDNLLRRFGIVSFLIIALLATGGSLLLAGSFTRTMLDRESRVTMDFVQNVFHADGSAAYLADWNNPELAARFRGSLLHLLAIPDLQRINVYSHDRAVLWSTEPGLVGRQFLENEELEKALRGDMVVEQGRADSGQHGTVKEEHVGLYPEARYFVETYIPIRVSATADVAGVVEIYKAPRELARAISVGHVQIWCGAATGGLLLYLALFGIVRSAHRRIGEQQERLRKSETLAAVGELAASMAHNIRNPLSSIRTSAELARDVLGEKASAWTGDIMHSADRIDAWLKDLIAYSHVDSAQRWLVDASAILRSATMDAAAQCNQRQIRIDFECNVDAALVRADGHLLGQVFQVLIDNAIHASRPGGYILARLVAGKTGVEIRISDTGSGISEENMPRLFELFFTTKPSGMGVGLALARRAVERFGGTIRAESSPGRGTAMIIVLPGAA